MTQASIVSENDCTMKAAVFYFSGTGTTEIAAGKVKAGLARRGYDVSLIRIEDVLKGKSEIDIRQYGLIGIGSQVIAFSTPRLVMKFVKGFPNGNHTKAFIFRLAGGVAPVNYNASNGLKRLLRRKGYDVFHERLFSIGSNWIAKFDDRVMQRLYQATCSKIDSFCSDIASGKPRLLKTGLFQKVLMESVGFMGQKAMPLVGKDYAVSGSCSHCGKCTRNCPAGNILERDGKIKFGFSCNGCMRCVYACPEHAIRLRALSFFVIPGGTYNVRGIVESNADDTGLQGIKRPPFFVHYVSDETF